MAKLRVGAVSYLNTKPLIQRLPELAPEIDLSLDVPSRLAVDLRDGRLDVGLIPSIEYFRGENYTIVPGVCIASFGPVMSVKLCSKVPLPAVRTVALDEGSRTSVALMKILLLHLFGIEPSTGPFPLDGRLSDLEADAVLLIGDRAMRVTDGEYPYTLDLGYEWSRWTGLPFVFAFWCVRRGVEVSPRTLQAFVRAKELGRRSVPDIADVEAERLGIDVTRCRYYLEYVIRHDFTPLEIEGLDRFRGLAVEQGLATEGVDCVFHGSRDLAQSR